MSTQGTLRLVRGRLSRAAQIAAAVPRAAELLARVDACRDDECRSFITEALYQHLVRHGLDFRADVLAAIDKHLSGRCAVCGTRTAGTYCGPCQSAVQGRQSTTQPKRENKRRAAATHRDWQAPLTA
jgi:hypothetical protein